MIRASFHKFADNAEYPQGSPFDPPAIFPEFAEKKNIKISADPNNKLYEVVRNLLADLELDIENYNTAEWNPFKTFVKKGQTVLIKPNLVTHRHPQGNGAIFATISHPSIIRVLIDYAHLAVGDEGHIIVGDTPIENCDFDVLCEITGLKKMYELLRQRGYRNLDLLDFRTFRTEQYPDSSVVKSNLHGDPRGYTDIDLGRLSLFQELEDLSGKQNYYTLGDHTIDHINPKTRKIGLPNKYHSEGRHIYKIPNSILDSDFVISLAKLKTHKFAGVTLCLKNAVGICTGKEYLPHRRPGTSAEGGDSFARYPSSRFIADLRLKRALYRIIGVKTARHIKSIIRKVLRQKLPHEVHHEPLYGDWYGNDTIWRTILDLNLALFHADRNGVDLNTKKRNYLGIIDGIIGMDHEAPMAGLPVRSNLLIAGTDPVAADILGTYLMGFDPQKITTITGVNAKQCTALGDTKLDTGQIAGNTLLHDAACKFVPTKGWSELLGRNSTPKFSGTTENIPNKISIGRISYCEKSGLY